MDAHKRHVFLYKIFRTVFTPFFRLRVNYRPEKHPIGGGCLVVSNHVTDLDPIMLGITVRDHVYFVASDHIFRKSFAAKLLRWAQDPILRVKGTTAGDTALTCIRRLRKGYNVALFAEGNRSYNGQTSAIIESTAKLARSSGATLVTHRFRGGYLTSPRWSGSKLRKGKMTGEVVGVYPPEQLKAMKPAAIAEIIRRDIYENAYETQREWMIPYKCKAPAEHLERALYLCPRCRKLNTLQSRGDELFCSCGLRTKLNEYGFFENKELPFDNVLDWDKWQAQTLTEMLQAPADGAIVSDTAIRLTEVIDTATQTDFGCGELRAYGDRFEFGAQTFPFADITGINLSGPQGLELSCGGRHWFLASAEVRDLRKYVSIYRAVTDPDNILAI